MTRVYLDNAATSWPKPESVYQAIDRYQRECGVAAGRGSYRAADEVQRIVTRCRRAIARLIGAEDPGEIAFAQNCTDALNTGIHGLLRSGDHVITSAADHNSVLRPLAACQEKGIEVSTVGLDAAGQVNLSELRDTLDQQNTRLIAITHVSNVTGVAQPIGSICELAREHDCLVLLDAAQSLGHETIDVKAHSIDMLAAPGHKGLFGPLGTGFLYIRTSLHAELFAIRQGGTGTQSELARHPDSGPAKYEAGNLNVPGIVGLEAGIDFVREHGLPESEHLRQLTTRLVNALRKEETIEVYSPANRFGIVSFNLQGMDPRELAATLDSVSQIEVRAGLHCAPLMHRALGTFDLGGTVRVSFGHFSNSKEVDKLVDVIQTLIANPMQ